MIAEYEVRDDLFQPYIRGNDFELVDGLCPECGKPLRKVDCRRYECTTPTCDIIEVRVSGFEYIEYPIRRVLAEIVRDSLS